LNIENIDLESVIIGWFATKMKMGKLSLLHCCDIGEKFINNNLIIVLVSESTKLKNDERRGICREGGEGESVVGDDEWWVINSQIDIKIQFEMQKI